MRDSSFQNSSLGPPPTPIPLSVRQSPHAGLPALDGHPAQADRRTSTAENPARKWRRVPERRFSGAPGRLHKGQSARTAHQHSEPLGWVEIQHPFHPLRGQSFPVLKKRRLAGVDTLILQGLEHGTFCVAREWTNWADPSLEISARRLSISSLLELVELLEHLGRGSPTVSTARD